MIMVCMNSDGGGDDDDNVREKIASLQRAL